MTDQDDTEPELTEVQKAYNVTQYELFQLAAYGHYTYDPERNNDGTFKTITERETNRRNYNQRLRDAQTRYEAAALLKAAEELHTAGKPTCDPDDGGCCWYDAVKALESRAAELLKEL